MRGTVIHQGPIGKFTLTQPPANGYTCAIHAPGFGMTTQEQDDQQDTLAGFEQSLSELETLVEALEGGDIGLEEALVKFERGVKLARSCQDALKTAELRVAQLTENSAEASITDFDPPQDDADA